MDDQNEENIGLGCALEMFSEVYEVETMIKNLKTIYNQTNLTEKAYDRFTFILHQYFEQPHLLDPSLERILAILIDIIRDPNNAMELKHETFKYMFVFVKVRGYKVVVRHLPHEVSDFEPVLKLLECIDPNDSEIWRSRYVLLIWMSIIIMLPFHMSRLDSFSGDQQENDSRKSVMTRVLDICKLYIVALDACRDAAVLLTSRFLSRSDVKEVHLKSFFMWAMETGVNSPCIFSRYGAMASIARILKQGKREDFLPHAPLLLDWIFKSNFKESKDTNILKYGYKIIQRIGLIFLKPRVASWRYKRGTRSLADNLCASGDAKMRTEDVDSTENDDDDIDVPDEIEEIIDALITGLGSSDGVVRWSAAKGIGRVTGRLPRSLADDVVGSVLELLNPRQDDGAWHGGCLTLAELGRRGLLLPSRLPDVVPVVLQALNYDVMKGYNSVGSHIRDAACYVCWSFARAYSEQDLAPFVPQIANALLVDACFDREINCRRAASAAFQENVGRQGTFPHGIDILTVADFYNVGVRTNAYLQISVYIAQFPEYTQSLIDHLVDYKLSHWDTALRELAAKALHNLTPSSPDYVCKSVLPKIFQMTTSIDLNARHGSVIAIGEIVLALANSSEKNVVTLIGQDAFENISDLIAEFNRRSYFRGIGGEVLKQACSMFIEMCSLARLPLHGQQTIEDWFNHLDDSLSCEAAEIRAKATSALPAFFNEYFNIEVELNTQPSVSYVIETYTTHLKSSIQRYRQGYATALGVLPGFILRNYIDQVMTALIQCSKIDDQTQKWAQSRRDSIKAITQICRSLDYEIYAAHIPTIYECFLTALDDYTQDNRGDIGAWVREAAMSGLQVITLNLALSSYLTPEFVSRTMQGVSKQAVERIDRTRALAGTIFSSLLHNKPEVPHIPHREELINIFPEDSCKTINWNSEGVTFALFTKLLGLSSFRRNVIFGLILSIGGLTEGLIKHSSAALFNYLNQLDANIKTTVLYGICNDIVEIFEKHQRVDRVTIPMFGFLHRFFNSESICCILDEPESTFPTNIFNLVKNEIIDCKNTYKLIDSISVFCQLIKVRTDVCKKALVRLSMFLCHRQKYIRKTTATKFYEALIMYGDSTVIPLETLDDAMNILSDTDWEQDPDTLRPVRNELCNLLGVKAPVVAPKAPSK